ncbi:hypothetical protein CIK64_18785 [Brevibacterium aurantiacum]|uniref:Uncharacterized protein n=1 Tax=Brevibacterium aurantiacum TaxID=273384 RepID=A0A2A3X6A7_BREAU|nr:hypothetical protein CXR23_06075 [Brevibacterium aurantiacum]PCC19233.1 hypothetical protein CIK79_13620 [Brevibacterium aurantiacum]PCC44852.1 hypothetical protein CIK64_18785 [Brevibacterium aurantiacum]
MRLTTGRLTSSVTGSPTDCAYLRIAIELVRCVPRRVRSEAGKMNETIAMTIQIAMLMTDLRKEPTSIMY